MRHHDQRGRRRIGGGPVALALVVVMAVVLVACTDKREAGQTPSEAETSPPAVASSTAPAAPSPTATPVTPTPPVPASPARWPSSSASVPIRFVPDEWPQFTGEEVEAPFAAQGAGDKAWSVYRVVGDGEPELLYRSGRYIPYLEWESGDDVGLRIVSTPVRPESARYAPDGDRLGGAVILRDVLGETSVEEVLPTPGAWAHPAPAGGRVAVSTHITPCDPAVSTGCRVVAPPMERIYVVERDGRSVRLDGLGTNVAFGEWSPDGEMLIVTPSRTTGAVENRPYVVPIRGAVAVPIEPKPSDLLSLSWSPDNTRFAFRAAGDIWIVERATLTARQLTFGAGLAPGFGLRWVDDGSALLAFWRSGVTLFAADTGQPRATVTSALGVSDAGLSPTGRTLAYVESWGTLPNTPGACEGPVWRNRILVHDLATGETRLIKDCDGPFANRLRWLADGEHLALISPRPNIFEGAPQRVFLLHVQSGRVRPLTDIPTVYTSIAMDKGNGRALITGADLRVYSRDGTLQRRISVPDGYDVTWAAWSHDGCGYVYVVGPSGFFVL